MIDIVSRFDTTQWLLFVIAVSVSVIAVCSFLTMGAIIAWFQYLGRRTSFSQDAQVLLDEGLLAKLIELCHKRMEDFHDDAHAHWYLGVALFRRGELKLALRYLMRVPELQPGWDVSAIVARIEEQLKEQDDKPDLKIVKPASDLDRSLGKTP